MRGQAGADADDVRRWEVQLRKGCLELAILASLWETPLYGLEIIRRLAEHASLMVPEGTIYPLLSRLRLEGRVEAEWVSGDVGHPRKYYRLTASGRRHAVGMSRSWARFAGGLDNLTRPLRKGNA